jgi:hypothetical protein
MERVVLTPGPDNRYQESAGPARFASGELVTLSASGGDVPPFATSVRVPTLTVSDPSCDGTSCQFSGHDLDATQPLTFTWSGCDGGEV